MSNLLSSYIAYLRVLLKDVSISVLALQRHTFLNPADGSVILSLIGNVIPLIVSKQSIMDM